MLLAASGHTDRAIALYHEFHRARDRIASWNGSTPKAVCVEYRQGAELLLRQVSGVVLEVRELRSIIERLGIPVAQVDPRPEFERISELEGLAARLNGSVRSSFSGHLAEYERNQAVQQHVAREIKAALAKGKSPGQS
jgi:hypothetical protein